ncbi:zona pellucida sperm-binding protein 3-like [Diretmus argenteus]
MSFSDLAALEAGMWDQTHTPDSHPADELGTDVEDTAGPGEVNTVVVRCHEDSIEVLMKAYLFGHIFPVEPTHWRLGSIADSQDHCKATISGDGEFTIRAPLSECGGKITVTEDAVVYNNLLLYTLPPSPRGVIQEEGGVVPVQCEYGRRYRVSSGALRPTWTPLVSTQSTPLHLDFHLRLMTDDWSDESSSSVYFLGEMIHIQASLDVLNHIPLSLYVHSCAATLTPDVHSHPRYPFIDHQGCFTDSRVNGSNSRFLPRVQDEILQIQLQPFLFHQDPGHIIYITCYLEAVPISKRDPVNKACSFVNGRWRSVDGDDDACESCDRDEERGHTSSAVHQSGHKRALRSRTKHMRHGPDISSIPNPSKKLGLVSGEEVKPVSSGEVKPVSSGEVKPVSRNWSPAGR